MPAEPTAMPERRLDPIGIQLFTLRALMADDFEGTLRAVASIGYEEVEFAGLFGNDPAQVKQLLAELNLTAVGSHVDWNRIRDDPDGAIEETLALGSHYLVFPFLPEGERQTLAQWQNWVVVSNQVGQACVERGLELAYHNHDFEFIAVEGVVPYDLLLEQVDRSVVKMELDPVPSNHRRCHKSRLQLRRGAARSLRNVKLGLGVGVVADAVLTTP